jgi:hypothetical protein
VAPDYRPSGATSRPKVGASIHGQRPWLSAAGVTVRATALRLLLSGNDLLSYFLSLDPAYPIAAEQNTLKGKWKTGFRHNM